MSDTSFTTTPGLPLPPNTPKPPAAPPKKSSKWVLLLLVLAISHGLVLILSGAIGFGIGSTMPNRQLHHENDLDSLAVLPFSGDWQPAAPGDNWPERRREYLEVILPDALSGQIAAKTRGSVKVLATHEIRGQHHPQQQPRNTGRDLSVRAVLSGQVSRDGRLHLQLISVASGELLWSGTYTFVKLEADAPRWHLPGAVEDEISRSVANRLRG